MSAAHWLSAMDCIVLSKMFRKMYRERTNAAFAIIQPKNKAVPVLINVNNSVLTVSIGPLARVAPLELQNPVKTGGGPTSAAAIAKVAMKQ